MALLIIFKKKEEKPLFLLIFSRELLNHLN